MAEIRTMTVNVKTKEKITDIREQTQEEIEQQAIAQAQQAQEEQRDTNRVTLQDKARNALAANKTFLDKASPTNADAIEQIKALTRQVNALIRLEAAELDEVD